MRRKKQKLSIPKPTAVRKTVVDFCKLNKMSVRQFVNNADRTRLQNTRDVEKMQQHLKLWNSYGWV